MDMDISSPFGVVFIEKEKKENNKKFLFCSDDVERYSNQQLSSILLRIKNCLLNDNEDKVEVRKIILWYMDIQKVFLQTVKILPKVRKSDNLSQRVRMLGHV